MSENELIKFEEIQSRIYTIHDVQVMLDEDLAKFYGVETRVLNQAVKRNINRFPESYMFQLAEDETDDLISQYVISSSGHGGRRKLPYVFTEQGVAMRRFITTNAHIFQRLDTLEIKQINTDKKIDAVLNAIERKEIQPKQGIFFDDQIFDAYKFVADLIRTAQRSITIIDNYIDDTVLIHLTKRNNGVKVTIFTKTILKQLALDIKKFNAQYPPIDIIEFKNSHDRFIIIDDKTVYHFGASLKDLGKKWFAFSKMDIGAVEMLIRLEGK